MRTMTITCLAALSTLITPLAQAQSPGSATAERVAQPGPRPATPGFPPAHCVCVTTPCHCDANAPIRALPSASVTDELGVTEYLLSSGPEGLVLDAMADGDVFLSIIFERSLEQPATPMVTVVTADQSITLDPLAMDDQLAPAEREASRILADAMAAFSGQPGDNEMSSLDYACAIAASCTFSPAGEVCAPIAAFCLGYYVGQELYGWWASSN